MSADVSGKQQKYSRIGAREYVPFEYEEVTFDNIVLACEKHFEKKLDKGMVCDILAGERGPSCNILSQIPDLKCSMSDLSRKRQHLIQLRMKITVIWKASVMLVFLKTILKFCFDYPMSQPASME